MDTNKYPISYFSIIRKRREVRDMSEKKSTTICGRARFENDSLFVDIGATEHIELHVWGVDGYDGKMVTITIEELREAD
jgi:hypothetical protein